MRVCGMPGCERKHYAKDLCKRHYRRWHEDGRPALKDLVRAVLERKRCQQCGVEEDGTWGRARKYCSSECRAAATRERARKQRELNPRYCQHCGGVLQGENWTGRKFCDHACYLASRRARARAARRGRHCQHCGGALEGRRKFCSSECYQAARRLALQRARKEKAREKARVAAEEKEQLLASEAEVARAQTEQALNRIRERDPFLAAQFQHELNKHRRRNNLPEVRL